jgi:hypothetical protein
VSPAAVIRWASPVATTPFLRNPAAAADTMLLRVWAASSRDFLITLSRIILDFE